MASLRNKIFTENEYLSIALNHSKSTESRQLAILMILSSKVHTTFSMSTVIIIKMFMRVHKVKGSSKMKYM